MAEGTQHALLDPVIQEKLPKWEQFKYTKLDWYDSVIWYTVVLVLFLLNYLNSYVQTGSVILHKHSSLLKTKIKNKCLQMWVLSALSGCV